MTEQNPTTIEHVMMIAYGEGWTTGGTELFAKQRRDVMQAWRESRSVAWLLPRAVFPTVYPPRATP